MDTDPIKTNISPVDKRKMFKTRYEELLIPHGFFFKGRNFYRLNMQEQIILLVAIHYGQSGGLCSLRIDALPFALGLSKYSLREGSIHIDGDSLLRRTGKNAPYPPFEDKFEAVYQAFEEKYLERFLSVHDLQSWNDFKLWVNGGSFTSYDVRRPWPCIILGQYDQAAYHVRHRIKWLEDSLSLEQKSLMENIEKAERFDSEKHPEMHPSTQAAWRRLHRTEVQFDQQNVEHTLKSIEERKQFLQLLDPPQVEYFENQVRQAISQSVETCRALFGKRAREIVQ